jgi:beta-mannosidase
MWCGGNELFCSWSGMSNQSHALRLLDKNCYELDRNTPFLMTSPLYGMGHGHYMPINSKSTEVYTDIVNSSFTAYTEFGMPSPSPIEYLKTFMEENELYDMTRDSVWDHHHGVSAWDMVSPSWFCTEHIKMYYGTEQTFEELIQNGLSLQSEIYKNIFEEVRRKAPYASMALNWCFNDPWPTAANNSIVNYPAIPKPSYESVKKSLQNILFSVRFNKMIWDVGDRIDCEMFLLNDLIEEINFNQLEILIYNSNREEILNIGKFNFKYQSKSVCKLFDFSINVNENFSDLFYVIIKSNKKTENEYALYIPNS